MAIRLKKNLARIILTLFLLNAQSQIVAQADPFTDAQELGNANRFIPSNSTLDKLPGYDANTREKGNALGSQYFKGGKSTVLDLNKGYQAGKAIKNESSEGCPDGDTACLARGFTGKKYSLNSPVNKYKSVAQSLAAGISDDPLATLGIGIPSQNSGSVCVESTIDTPPTKREVTCLESQFKSMNLFSKIPVTVGAEYTSPVCLDPAFAISGDYSNCSKTTYSCPAGEVLDGTNCIKTYDANTTYGAVECSDQLASVIGYKGSRNVTLFQCVENGDNDYIRVSARGAGTDGGAIVVGDFWHTLDLSRTYTYNQGVVPVAGHWSGWFRKGSLAISGGCTNGWCNFNTRMGRSHTTWRIATFSCPPGSIQPWWSSPWRGNPPACQDENTGKRVESVVHCPAGMILESSPYREHIYGASMYICGKSGFMSPPHFDFQGHATFSFADPRKKEERCNPGDTLVGSKCKKVYPATATVHKVTPGCLGGKVYSSGELVAEAPVLVYGHQSGGIKTCSSAAYSCPSGMYQNGFQCKEDGTAVFESNPRCVNLGYDDTNTTQGFYCSEKKLDECSELPDDCVKKTSSCIFYDQVPKSPTAGQCLATESVYECPVPGKTTTVNNCGYEPMCLNGNCFEPPGKQCQGITETVRKSFVKSCYYSRKQEFKTCSTREVLNSAGNVIGVTPGADCASFVGDSQCVQIPSYRGKNGQFPDTMAFSCLSAETNDCDPIKNDPYCDASSAHSKCINEEEFLDKSNLNNVTSISTGRCILKQEDYACYREYEKPGDECTEDLTKALVSLETGRQAGGYAQFNGFDINTVRVFKGETSRCDRRSAAWAGAGFGSKSCCNINAPDPKTNADITGSQIASVVSQVVDYSVSKGSAYAYDFMMNSDAYYNTAMELWQNGIISDQAAMNAIEGAGISNVFDSVTFTPSIGIAGVSLGYAGGVAVPAGSFTAGGATATSTLGLGGGFQLSFNPVGFYIYAAIKLYQSYTAALACDEEDYKTATKGEAVLCYTTHTYCASKSSGIFGSVCQKYRTVKCCYNSRLARIINEQGKVQLGITGKADTCNGFSVEQINQIDWSKIDLTEFVAEMLTQVKKGIPTTEDLTQLKNKVTGTVTPTEVIRRYDYTP